MSLTATRQAEELLRDSLKELESAKGSVLSGVQKLYRAAEILGEGDVVIWCEIQLGDSKYTGPLRIYIEKFTEAIKAGDVLEAAQALEVSRSKAPVKSSASKKATTRRPREIKEAEHTYRFN